MTQFLEHSQVDFSTNIGFDLTVTTTICAICLGAQVIVYGGQLKELESYKDYLIKNNINVIKLVPDYFSLLLDYLPNTKINKVVLGGEKFNPDIAKRLQDLFSENSINLIVYDEYGPTETTIGTCISQVYPGDNFNIGAPISNSKAYVLLSSNMSSTSCSSLTPLPIGAIGELYIGGVGLARGYLNQSDLTSEKFISNPFQTEEEKNDKTYGARGRNSRLYKTGDLVRWLPDGNLEYIGRTDFQVKIRGYRIELGEIETAISSYSGVKQCVVLAKEHKKNSNGSDTTKYLVAYYSSSNPRERLDEESILSYLEQKLPAYMVPRTFVHLEVIPLTANGKLDRKALPDIEWEGDKDKYVAPRNELESKICAIWAKLLGIDIGRIGINDDFFSLGGDSIMAIRLVSNTNKEIPNNPISILDLLKHNTIAKLANYIVELYTVKQNKGETYEF